MFLPHLVQKYPPRCNPSPFPSSNTSFWQFLTLFLSGLSTTICPTEMFLENLLSASTIDTKSSSMGFLQSMKPTLTVTDISHYQIPWRKLVYPIQIKSDGKKTVTFSFSPLTRPWSVPWLYIKDIVDIWKLQVFHMVEKGKDLACMIFVTHLQFTFCKPQPPYA